MTLLFSVTVHFSLLFRPAARTLTQIEKENLVNAVNAFELYPRLQSIVGHNFLYCSEAPACTVTSG